MSRVYIRRPEPEETPLSAAEQWIAIRQGFQRADEILPPMIPAPRPLAAASAYPSHARAFPALQQPYGAAGERMLTSVHSEGGAR